MSSIGWLCTNSVVAFTCTRPSGDVAMRAPAPARACRVALQPRRVTRGVSMRVRTACIACMCLFRCFPRENCLFMRWKFQEYSVQLTFREQWLDERLKFNDFGGKLKYLTLTEANRVWMPDLFFSNEKEGHFHNIIMPNVYIRIFPYGSVLYSIRYETRKLAARLHTLSEVARELRGARRRFCNRSTHSIFLSSKGLFL